MKYTEEMILHSDSGYCMPFEAPQGEDVELSLGYGEQTHPETGEMILAGVGRFGPYLKIGDRYKSIPADDDVLTITIVGESPLGYAYVNADNKITFTPNANANGYTTFTYRLDDRAWTNVDAVTEAAARTGKSAAQIALNWVLHRRGITAPIIAM